MPCTTHGDITVEATEQQIEDIFKYKSKYDETEIGCIEFTIRALSTMKFTSKRDYSEKLKAELKKYKGKYKSFPSKTIQNLTYRRLLKSGIISRNVSLEKYLKRKFLRSASGELPITVFTSPSNFDCPEDCFYCPDEKVPTKVWNKKGTKQHTIMKRIQPRSYLSTEPGCMRAEQDGFHPLRQSYDRMHSLDIMGHTVDKIRYIILGGTYCYYPLDYRIWFITSLYYACNTYYSWKNRRPMLSLKEEMQLNRDATVRVSGITVETRPDRCTLDDIAHFMHCGITTVQLGIQQLDNDILKKINRNCTVKKIIDGTKRVLDCGLKLDTHYMFDLPGASPKKDICMIDKFLNDSNFNVADQMKLYPTSTTPYTTILKWYNDTKDFLKQLKFKISAIKIQNTWRMHKNISRKYCGEQRIDLSKKKYFPYAEVDNGSVLVDVLIYAKSNIHKDVRLNRVIRDIPEISIVGGNKITNLRQEIHKIMEDKGLPKCRCIRCREIAGGSFDPDEIKLDVYTRIKAGYPDHFISFEDKQEKIYGLARLRLLDDNADCLPILKNKAVIREVHVYGATVKTADFDPDKPQHSGLGKRLLAKCEDMAIKNGYSQIVVTSGEGVIRYYQKRGYRVIYDSYNGTEYHYMIKDLNKIYDIYWLTHCLISVMITLIAIIIASYLIH